MKNKGRVPVLFCGFQERVGKRAIMLVTVIETKSTVAYDSDVHDIVAGEGWSKETGMTVVNLTKEIKWVNKLLNEALTYGFSRNQEVWRLRKQVKYLQNRIKEGYRDGENRMADNTEK